MHGFTERDLRERDSFYEIWRTPTVVFMCVTGVVDDAKSAQWQAALQREFDRNGYPRFYAMDISAVEPTNTMRARFATAGFIRATLARIEYCVVHTGARPGPLVVSRTLLRLVGMGNIRLATSENALTAALDSMRSGVTPRDE